MGGTGVIFAVSAVPMAVWSLTSGSFNKFSIIDSIGDVSPNEEFSPCDLLFVVGLLYAASPIVIDPLPEILLIFK